MDYENDFVVCQERVQTHPVSVKDWDTSTGTVSQLTDIEYAYKVVFEDDYDFPFCEIDMDYWTWYYVNSTNATQYQYNTECSQYEYYDINYAACTPVYPGFETDTTLFSREGPTDVIVTSGFTQFKYSVDDGDTFIENFDCPLRAEQVLDGSVNEG